MGRRIVPRRAWRSGLALLCLGPFLVSSCATKGTTGGSAGTAPLLSLTQAEREALAERPELLGRVRADPYTYFRLLTSMFSQRVCAEFVDLAHEMPLVNLHGDAHIGQYAITLTAHGLDDFDEAGTGPAVVDLVRFAASIHMACRSTGFVCEPDAAVEAFLDGYEAALANPDAPVPTPSWVEAARRQMPGDRLVFLEWAESLMADPDPEERAGMMERWGLFVNLMTRLRPQIPDDYHSVQRFGSIDIGVGSAFDAKYLLRIRGPSDDPEDDVIVEIKPMNQVTASCLLRTPAGGMLRILLPAVRLGRLKPAVLGYLPWEEGSHDESQWWVHSWDFGYRELTIGDLTSQAALEEIARDVGLQLGWGHCNWIGAPLEDLHREAQARALELSRDRVRTLARQLADEVFQGWVRFREGG